MNVSDIQITLSFLSELAWAKDTIQKLREYKIKNAPIGLKADTLQPDQLFIEFASRDLVLEPYMSTPARSLGAVEAYTRNIATLIAYIARARQDEIRSAHETLREIVSLKAQEWPVGLSWPDGRPDSIAVYFAIRNLPLACYFRGNGNVNVGDPGAYDRNAATLEEYVRKVAESQLL